MISVKEARAIIKEQVSAGNFLQEDRRILDALGYYLATAPLATTDVPGFDQSAMDGYAIRMAERGVALKVTQENYAGVLSPGELSPGEAVRIFTGAPIPYGADTVVVQEKVVRVEDYIRAEDPGLTRGRNIRVKGESIKKGQLLLAKGTRLTAAKIGLLASAGVDLVRVYKKPRVSLIVTGSELQIPGRPLVGSQLYDANSYQLMAALKTDGVDFVFLKRVKDDREAILEALKQALIDADLIILTGGVSVGEYDYVVQVLEQLGVERCFYKICQKPGKPLLFGKTASKFLFGLPGNPAAAFGCYQLYVRQAIRGLCGASDIFEQPPLAHLQEAFEKPAGNTYFLKGYFNNDWVEILKEQQSYKLSSLARANCLIELPSEASVIKKGELVGIHFLSQEYV
ncbi:molybdopterin molybdochelatase [Arachidicoccus rhizosphaerae]|uniref:Molybdopterin molybdenumtransferase n=1 Tax=Arachidicoccus rhizosphaerae TaxID=551991 RepID=A0A1H3WB94_9BACT|nr:molybdopterin molybdochelatase [Arachidicoccus rhizosphaerae]